MNHMLFKRLSLLTTMCIVVAAATSHAADLAYNFETVDVKVRFKFLGDVREDVVRLTDIDNKGRLVGNDFAGDSYVIDDRRKAKEIRCPGGHNDNDSATVSAINNLGQLVGSCANGAFIREKNGNITILNFPNAEGTVALGINDLGHVVGQYWGNAFGQGLQRFHGFLWKDGEYTTIDAPFSEAMATTLSGINNAGQIIGTFLHHRPGSPDINEYDGEIGFIYDNGNFTEVSFPGAQIPFCCGAETFPMDINNHGYVMGSTYDQEGKLQVFLLVDGEYFRITGLPENVVDFSGAWGINDKAQIAGTYLQRFPCDSCGFAGEPGYTVELHSFVAKPKRALIKQLVN